MKFPNSASPLGIHLIRRDHREIGDMLVELDFSILSAQSMQRIEKLMRHIHLLTLTHFALEECLMKASTYPALSLHLLEHQWLAEQCLALETRARHQGIDPGDPLLKFMMHSHTGHICHSDAKYEQWLDRPRIPFPLPGNRESGTSGLMA